MVIQLASAFLFLCVAIPMRNMQKREPTKEDDTEYGKAVVDQSQIDASMMTKVLAPGGATAAAAKGAHGHKKSHSHSATGSQSGDTSPHSLGSQSLDTVDMYQMTRAAYPQGVQQPINGSKAGKAESADKQASRTTGAHKPHHPARKGNSAAGTGFDHDSDEETTQQGTRKGARVYRNGSEESKQDQLQIVDPMSEFSVSV